MRDEYAQATDAELAESLDGLADGQEDDLGRLLSTAADRLRWRAAEQGKRLSGA